MVPHRFGRLAWSLLALIVTSVTVVSTSCDKMPLTAPAGSAILLSVSTNILPVNGSTEILAVILEGGQGTSTGNQPATPTAGVGTPVHNGTLVTFTTTLGRIEPAEARTEAGRVTVRLIADGRSGTATVTAISGAARATTEVKIGAAGAARVLVTATPQALPATGGMATISARVEDQQGNGLLGVLVSFSTSAGTLGTTNVITGNDGTATTTLTTTAAATVTASAGGGTSGTLTNTVAITIKPRAILNLAVPATSVVSVPTSITAGVGQGGAVITSASIDLGDGTPVRPLGALSQDRNVIHHYGAAGVYLVTLKGTDADGVTTETSSQIAVSSLTATLSCSPATVPLGGSVICTVILSNSAASINSYTWDMGAGEPAAGTTKSPQQQWIFNSRGTKTVKVTIQPTAGAAFTILAQVNVT